jgi:hypothetical protein
VGVKDSELVVCGDVDKSYLRVVEDWIQLKATLLRTCLMLFSVAG